ncbi:MAG: glycine oxidase ThiO [Gammaproteobacteria bacterium]|nr:glycine oxidase ThiO [Gammaproteobacteria bacterium]
MADCIVVGAGISGVLSALELEQAGADVILLERDRLGAESSWAGGGIISPLYPWRYPDAVSQLARYGQQHYPALLDKLQLESGIDPQYQKNGLLVLDLDEQQQANEWARNWQQDLQLLDAAQTLACEPALSSQHQASLWLPEVAQLRNPRLVKAMSAVVQRRKIRLHEHSVVSSIRIKNNKVQGVNVADQQYNADQVLIAGGAWSGQILKQLKLDTTIEPVKGQMILLKGEPDLLKRIVLSDGKYIIPRRDGRILVGSTLEHTEFKKELTAEAKQGLYHAATDMMPVLAGLEVEHHWAGLRPGSGNGVPYIGEHPSVQGLFFNAGHFRNGVVLGLASARLTADIILGRSPIFDPAVYGIAAEH